VQTDIPLKRLTQLRPTDLLSLLGTPDAIVLDVETLELPASKTSLDTVLRLRRPDGQQYLHLVEWQGYRDPLFLWRTLGYLAWLGQNRRERPILVTVMYLTPDDDVGDRLDQAFAEHQAASGWSVTIPCIRLWELDAAQIIAGGKPGLVALSPLMGGATEALVEQAARLLIEHVDPPVQSELLAALGIFAEPLIAIEKFVRLVTKERLMTSDLITYLTMEKTAELEHKLVDSLQHATELLIMARFPNARVTIISDIRRVTDEDHLRRLLDTIAQAPDIATVEQALELIEGE
jgi:hypothetical protein